MKNNILPVYKCTQNELYAVCRLIWLSFISHLTTFTSRKAYYNAVYGNAALAENDAAQLLPDYQARGEASESFKVQLGEVAKHCMMYFLLLKSHIEDAYDENLVKPKLEAAGSLYYSKAKNNNWEDTKKMMVAVDGGAAVPLAVGSDVDALIEAAMTPTVESFRDGARG